MRSTSKKSRILRAYLVFLTSVACFFIVYFAITYSGKQPKKNADISSLYDNEPEKMTDEKCLPICDSKECIFQANMLLRNMKPTTDPCNNYGQFLCGSYQENVGPDTIDGILYETTMVLWRRLRGILENIPLRPGSVSEKMKIMYDSCMDIGSSQLRGVEDLQKFLNAVGITNWPNIAPDYKFSVKGLSELLGFFAAYKTFPGFAFLLGDGHDFELIYDYVQVLATPFLMKAIEKDVSADILSYFNIDTEEIKVILDDHATVTATMLNITEESGDYCEENCGIHINCSTTDDGDWEFICKTVESFLNVTELRDYVSSNEIVISPSSSSFFKQLVPRLKLIPDRSFANFFALSLLWKNIGQLNFYFRLKSMKYFKHFQSEMSTEFAFGNRWFECVSWLAKQIKLPLEQEYAKHYLSNASIEEILEMHNESISRVSDMIDNQEWISSRPRPFIKRNIRDLKSNMIYLKEILSDEGYAGDFFKTFHPVKTSFFQNVLEYNRNVMNTHSRLKLRGHNSIEGDFKVNAASHELEDFHGIVLHYGYLMPPFYYPGYKKSLNRITLARPIGHEIGHVLVDRLNTLSMAFRKIQRGFTEKKICIADQFSKFKFLYLDEHLNGTLYYVENLADNVGYMFLDNVIRNIDPSEEYFLPGMSNSPKQLFYMLAGQIFCHASNLQLEMLHKTQDPHPPFEYRIIGTAQNSKGFSEAFKCPEGSYMNPTTKCSLLDSM